jgi:hypothetical protein
MSDLFRHLAFMFFMISVCVLWVGFLILCLSEVSTLITRFFKIEGLKVEVVSVAFVIFTFSLIFYIASKWVAA